jgi:hypothetical protein
METTMSGKLATFTNHVEMTGELLFARKNCIQVSAIPGSLFAKRLEKKDLSGM